jgi:hypothetical protein
VDDRDAIMSSDSMIVFERPRYFILRMFKCGIKATLSRSMELGAAPESSRLRLASCPLWVLIIDYS